MRKAMILRSLGLAALVAALPGACKWTDFDDLKEDTWVTSTGKPENPAENWGVALARVQRDGAGGTLGVLGANEAFYNDIVIGPDGDVTVTNGLELNTEFAIGNLAAEPIFLARPDDSEAALVTGLEANRILVIRSSGGRLTQLPVSGLSQPTAATYLVTPPRMGDPGPTTQILVAQPDAVFGAYFNQANAPNPQPRCGLRDEAGAAVNIRALGAYRPTGAASDDFLVLTETGKLMVYDGALFHGCMAAQPPRTGLVRDTMFPNVGLGSQIFTIPGTGTPPGPTLVLVQLHDDNNRGRLALYRIDAAAIEAVGAPLDVDRLATATLFEPGDGKRYVLAGQPRATPRGVTGAGQVQAFELDLTTGIAMTPAMTLFDAEPEEAQAFGRAVTVVPYNGKRILAVAADNDVYVYFRTTLYAETREGR